MLTAKDILPKFKSIRILVIGDVMIDHYLWGSVNRISPEAPVPVLHVTKQTNTLGGSGNVALNLAVLGANVELLSSFGKDTDGQKLKTLLRDAGISTPRCYESAKIPTIVKTRVVAQTQQICRIDHEAPMRAYDLEQNKSLPANLEKAIAAANAVIVSDYAKGCITQSLLNKIIQLARKHKAAVSIDPKPSRRLNLKGLTLMTPNKSEALALAGYDPTERYEQYPLAEIAQKIHSLYAPKILVVTMGADGMAICEKGKVIKTLPTQAREVFDVSGAGDTVIATLTAALAAGADPISAANLANHAAGVVVSKMGTATASPAEIIQAAA